MLANIRKSQEDGWLYGVTYSLDVELELTPEELHVIDRHGIADMVIFDSEARDAYAKSTDEYLEATKQQPSLFAPVEQQLWGIATTFYNIGAAAYNATMGSMSLRITVQDLLDSAHIETDNLDEILTAERLIRDAVQSLQDHVMVLATFEGQDDLIEPE
jgi:hypothetical protein